MLARGRARARPFVIGLLASALAGGSAAAQERQARPVTLTVDEAVGRPRGHRSQPDARRRARLQIAQGQVDYTVSGEVHHQHQPSPTDVTGMVYGVYVWHIQASRSADGCRGSPTRSTRRRAP